MMYRIESFLSSRLHLAPQLVDDRIYFISNLSGKLSLYGMYYGSSVPEPLLPPYICHAESRPGGRLVVPGTAQLGQNPGDAGQGWG